MKKTYKIEVDCANCANKMEEAAKNTDGVKDAAVNFMATLILRPVRDESIGHSYSSGDVGYAMISESSADDDSTYIYQTVSSTSSASVTSSFTLGGTMPSGSFKITGATLYGLGGLLRYHFIQASYGFCRCF